MEYRIIDGIAARIAASPPRLGPVRLVAVDGPGGAGKSTLARRIAGACAAQVVHTDDFATRDNPLDWWPRLEELVLEPLAGTQISRYQHYDWEQGRYTQWHEVTPAGVVILEGVSSGRAAVRDRLSLLVWVNTPRHVRLDRGLQRDGADAAALWQRWMADEDQHFAADDTRAHADLVVNGDDTAQP